MTRDTSAHLPDHTPVIIGVGQVSERFDEDGYGARSVVELAAEAARRAVANSGGEPVALAQAIDMVAAVRPFEIAAPIFSAPFGRSTNLPRSVATRIGADPRRAVIDVSGGNSPQTLVIEVAREIAAGRVVAGLVVGAEALSTQRHLADVDHKPDWSESPSGDLEDRGMGLAGLVSRRVVMHGLVDAPSQYALFENARRAASGLSKAEYAASMGALFEPFTRVAAKNPHAVAPEELDAATLVRVDERNRMIASPYSRLLVSRELVNQGAAVIVTSVGEARRLGIAEDRWVYLIGHADLRERDVFDRQDLAVAPSAGLAVRHALEVAGLSLDDVAWFDLYSCFPIAVSNVLDRLGLDPTDSRGFTVTGGLPFFGGPGNNYSTHAIAEIVELVRSSPGSVGLVGANGGTLSKYAVGIYSSSPATWQDSRSRELQAEINAAPPVEVTDRPDGWATIETYTVLHGRSGRTAVVIGRLDDGRRFIANGVPRDDEFLDFLEGPDEPIGTRVFVRATGPGNIVALSPARLEELSPRPALGLRDDYEHVLVERRDHVLEITLNRPDSRNSLHPPAHEELDQIFDSYFADSDLWVAIITGAGDAAFCAGNDLAYTATGKPVYIPPNGFGGITWRATLPKPVIAAVNGFAMGGGFEIALSCHLVVADERAQFALSEVKVGLIAAAGGLARLPRAIPPKIANELALTGRRMLAEEAHRYGVVNRLAPAGNALEVARELASEIVSGSPTSVRLSLKYMEEARRFADEAEAAAAPSATVDELMTSEDAMEGIRAFAEKRAPVWKNR